MARINFILKLLFIITLTSVIECAKRFNDDNYLPATIQITLLIHPYNKLIYLPYMLGSLESQNYPKNRIRIHIITERIFYEESYYDNDHSIDHIESDFPFDILDDRIRQNDETITLLKLWTRKNRFLYNGIELTISNVRMNENLFGEGSNNDGYWNKERFKFIIDTKNQELFEAFQSWADYVMFMDSDVILVDVNTLSNLTDIIQNNDNMIAVAPMLYSLTTYSNFWAGMDDNGYYLRTEEYLPILEQQQTGTFPVPMIHTCFIIDCRKKKSRALTFDPNEVENETTASVPYDDIIAFAKSASNANIQLYIDNRFNWGYIPSPINEMISQKVFDIEISQELVDLELESLIEGPEFPISSYLESFVRPIEDRRDTLLVDEIYVINLRRRFERRVRMEKSLKVLGIRAKFWDATDGKQLTNEYLEKHDIKSLKGYVDPFHKRLMTLGEIGCFLSHYRVWEDAWRNNYTKIIIFEDDVRFEKRFRKKWFEALDRFEKLEPIYDFLYLGRKLNGRFEETKVDDGFFVKPEYSYWTIGYMITRTGIEKLLRANPLRRLIPVDEFLPIMYGAHRNTTLALMYDRVEHLNALSLQNLIISPTHYVGDPLYISDTEDSGKISDKNTAAEKVESEDVLTKDIDRSYHSKDDNKQAKLFSGPQPPPNSYRAQVYSH
ncbi:hypothetical protein RDWZM_003006 [Blomia tropicalis]|uniref:Glycosyl transferase family 25 domain-containing protein n=1 Tax=Blomia tropicalis TaxID=40697 RepID=A0A9Q0MEF6_BLOTA|nr:hypothetical protein RDWZM_003006 [Blomia tropicalis]